MSSQVPDFIGKTLALLTPREKRQGILVFLMMVALAFFETAGVASIMPFLAVLGNPELVETNAALAWAYERGGFESTDRFLFALGVGAFILVVVSAGFRIAKTYVVNRYVENRDFSISTRLLQAYLRQPYAFFLDRNSADMSKRVLSEARQAVTLAIRPAMELVSYGLVAFVLVALLVVVDPVVAVVVALVVGGIYGIVYLSIRKLLRRIGTLRVEMNRARYQAAGEAFGGIKDLKVLGREDAYLNRFRVPAASFARYQYLKETLAAVPKYFIEAVAFGGILGLALFLMASREDLGAVLPLLGVYAFAGYRLLPAAQNIFKSLSSLRFGEAAVDTVYQDLVADPPPRPVAAGGAALKLTDAIVFDSVKFTYPGAEHPALLDLELTIPARSSMGFVGQTGAGKTTAVDLILGLLQPTDGRMLVDGLTLEEVGLRRWQKAIGYVPQQIYLADASVASNIAFGVEPEHIDHQAVEKAARVARIHDFIVGHLREGYATEVGERGVRLSGGQRQRIGIARALYHDPQVLVFDEATSALDNRTERSIMEAVEELSGQKTLIMIAHRLSTVEACDQIVVLQDGRIKGTGSYKELKATSALFRSLAVA